MIVTTELQLVPDIAHPFAASRAFFPNSWVLCDRNVLVSGRFIIMFPFGHRVCCLFLSQVQSDLPP